jgi:beta-glucanase (GH16 family)
MSMAYPYRAVILILVSIGILAEVRAQDWELVWQDEFDGDSLDMSKWSFQYGTGSADGLVSWGNNELQYYTDRPENIYVADGKLHIVARQEQFVNRSYTSARIRTINKGDWKYGRFEIRAKLPEGRGLWPAIWMMPTESVYGVWAASGEIDIMELVGHVPDVVHGTLHYGARWPNNVERGASYRKTDGKFSDDFHTFSILWRENDIRWYVDGQLYQIRPGDWYTEGHPFPAPFDQKFHMLLNVAVGGNWPGSPNQSTSFPQEMVVDYVRVYQQVTNTSSNDPHGELPSSIQLHQNYPNPFNPATRIEFTLPQAQDVSLDVYDVMGRHVRNLAGGIHASGYHAVNFDASALPSGLYTYRLRAGANSAVRSMLLLK